jgi:hypothetical protein
MKRITFEVSGSVTLEVSDKLLARLDELKKDEFFGNLAEPKDMMENLAFNFVQNNANLTQLDGYADLEDADCKLVNDDFDYRMDE